MMQPSPRDHTQTQYAWPGEDDKAIVAEMLNDPSSPHWTYCREFFMHLMNKLKVPIDERDDVVQKIMITVVRNLHTFKHDCKLTTWLIKTANWRKDDRYRSLRRERLQIEPLKTAYEESEEGVETPQLLSSRTVEDECIGRETLSEVVAKLQHYALTRNDTERCWQVMQKVFFEQQSAKETAKELGIEPYILYYIIREVRKYLKRE